MVPPFARASFTCDEHERGDEADGALSNISHRDERPFTQILVNRVVPTTGCESAVVNARSGIWIETPTWLAVHAVG